MRPIKLIILSLFVTFSILQISLFNPGNVQGQSTAPEAPAGFDNLTNGFTDQASYDANRQTFNEQEQIEDGLGPVYNAQSCGECHQNPIAGGISQITELRAGHYDGTNFISHIGGSLINDRAIAPDIQELVLPGNEVRTFRTSLNTLGDGFVECIADDTLIALSKLQTQLTNGGIAGQVVMVPVMEAGGALRVGRFGWKDQQASLLSFSADAYLNEMGITSPLLPTENSSNGRSVSAYDSVSDPEDRPTSEHPNGVDVEAFAAFMRASKAPPRANLNTNTGLAIFIGIGCAICHVPTLVTAPAGTVINGGSYTVPAALGNKTIHPFSDFLLHDIGSGDGIVQNGGPTSRNKMRTSPLWGVRTRTRLMHDGGSYTYNDAILRHGGEANKVTRNYLTLSSSQKAELLKLLGSL